MPPIIVQITPVLSSTTFPMEVTSLSNISQAKFSVKMGGNCWKIVFSYPLFCKIDVVEISKIFGCVIV
jgi:hypothetical protein